MLAMPRPRSTAIRSRLRTGGASCSRRIISPPPPCLIRLVAASVAINAARPRCSSVSPARVAMSRANRRASATWLLSLTGSTIGSCTVIRSSITPSGFPPDDTNGRPLSGRGFDFKLVRQPARAAQPEAEAAPGRVSIAQRQLHVLHAGPVVDEAEADPDTAILSHHFELHRAAAAVNDRVPGEFA